MMTRTNGFPTHRTIKRRVQCGYQIIHLSAPSLCLIIFFGRSLLSILPNSFESLCGIVAHGFRTEIHGRHFDDDGKISPCLYRNRDLGMPTSRMFTISSVLPRRSNFLSLLQSSRLTIRLTHWSVDCACPEQRHHIDDADSADFDQMAKDARRLTDQRIFIMLVQIDAIVSNQTVSFLDQFKAVSTSDTAVPCDHDTHSKYVNENPCIETRSANLPSRKLVMLLDTLVVLDCAERIGMPLPERLSSILQAPAACVRLRSKASLYCKGAS